MDSSVSLESSVKCYLCVPLLWGLVAYVKLCLVLEYRHALFMRKNSRLRHLIVVHCKWLYS